ncbi:hypothetical protein ACFLT1_02005 [Bacteroidota bacterium]
MDQNTYNPKAAFRAIRIIYFAILIGPVIFLSIVLTMKNWNLPDSGNITDPLNIGFVLILLTVPMVYKQANKVLTQKQGADFRHKMATYQTSLIIKVAIWEGLGIFSAVVLLLADNTMALLFFAMALVGIISNFPNPFRFGPKIGLNSSEIEKLKF